MNIMNQSGAMGGQESAGISSSSTGSVSMSSASRQNNTAVPEARGALNRFKEEVATELGVPLKQGYNGDLTSRQAGSIGGEMVKQMIAKQEQQMSGGSSTL